MIRPQDSLAMAMNPKRPERRVLTLVLAVIATAGLAYAAVSRQWMYNEATLVGGAYGFGPRGMFHCTSGKEPVCDSATNGAMIAAWRREVADAQLVSTMLGTVDIGLLLGTVQPATLTRTGRQLAISGDAKLLESLEPARAYDLDATTPDGLAGLYVATAKATLTGDATELEIDDYVARAVDHQRVYVQANQTTREQAIADAQLKAKSIAEQNITSGAFALCGWLALVGCGLAALSLAIAVMLVALRQRRMLPIMPTTTALLGIMLAIITGCVFVATKPGGSGFVGVSFGFWGFAVGIILGIASTLMLNGLLRPEDDDLLAEPMNADHF